MEIIGIISEDAHGPPEVLFLYKQSEQKHHGSNNSELMGDRVSGCCFYLASAESLLQTHCVLS